MCTFFSQLKSLYKASMGVERYEECYRKAVSHLKFTCELYRQQIDQGGLILHEHPEMTSSWDLPCIQEILARDDVSSAVPDMCAYGMAEVDQDGIEKPVRKATRWMSNSARILRYLSKRCARTTSIAH